MADDREQLYEALRNADAAGDTKAAQRLAEYIQSLPSGVPNTEIDPSVPRVDVTGHYVPDPPPAAEAAQAEPSDNLLGVLVSPIDAALTAGSAALGGVAGAVAGAGNNIINGRAPGAREGEEFGSSIAEKILRQPSTQAGRRILEVAEPALAALGALPTAAMADLAGAGANASRAVRGAVLAKAAETNAPINAADAALAAAPKAKLADLVRKPQPTLSGVGSAAASKDAVRIERFERFGVKPTLGQITRNKQQLKFEKETAKLEEGKALDDHAAEQNAQVQRKFEELKDAYEPNVSDPRDVGNSVIDAVEAKAMAKKKVAQDLYTEADAAGEMAEPVDITNVLTFVKANKGKDKIAPIISMIESELGQNAQSVGGGLDKMTLTPTPKRLQMSLKATEDLRQAINDSMEPGTSNMVWGKRAMKLIDAATEDKGGPMYRQARRAWENYMNEFEDREVIAKLLRNKPGTKDRAVVPEEVFKHLILNPKGKDDISHVFRVLEAHPSGMDPAIAAAGKQAAANLRAALVSHIQEQMFSNGGANAFGDVVGSQKKILNAVNSLDRRGTLKAVLGREGADYMRDLRDLSLDVYTVPEGAVNHSNNVGPIVAALTAAEKYAKPIPGVKQVAHGAAEIARSRAIAKRVDQALNPKKAVSGSPFNSSQKRPNGATVH